jgi:hypothetical protein
MSHGRLRNLRSLSFALRRLNENIKRLIQNQLLYRGKGIHQTNRGYVFASEVCGRSVAVPLQEQTQKAADFGSETLSCSLRILFV